MKKQFESEIDRVAPFRKELQAEIIRKSSEKAKFKYAPMLAMAFSVVAVLIVGIVVGTGVLDSGPDSTSLPPIDEEKEQKTPLTNIPILEKYSLDGQTWEANFEIHKYLKETWNLLSWNPNETVGYDYDYDYQIGMIARRDQNSPTEELWFYLWYDGDGFTIDGDFGVAEIRGHNAQQLGSILGMDTDIWNDGTVDKVVVSDFDIAYYSLFDKQRVSSDEKTAQWQRLFENVEWLPGVEVEREEGPSLWVTVAIVQDDERIIRKQVDLFINEEKQIIELGGDLGNGKVAQQYYEQWIAAINEEAETTFSIRYPRNDAEAALFKQLLAQMETENYHYVNGASIEGSHVLNIDGKIYYFLYDHADGMLLIKQTKLNFAYFDQSAFRIKDQLNEISVNDMEALLEELTFESASVIKTTDSMHEFTWGTDSYKVVLADDESTYQLVKSNRLVASLTEQQFKNMKLYLQEVGMGFN